MSGLVYSDLAPISTQKNQNLMASSGRHVYPTSLSFLPVLSFSLSLSKRVLSHSQRKING